MTCGRLRSATLIFLDKVLLTWSSMSSPGSDMAFIAINAANSLPNTSRCTPVAQHFEIRDAHDS